MKKFQTDSYVKKKMNQIEYIKQKKNGFKLDENNFFKGYTESNKIKTPNENLNNINPNVKFEDISPNIRMSNTIYNSKPITLNDTPNDTSNDLNKKKIVTWYETKMSIINQKITTKHIYNEIIPRKIFVCWKTKLLPEKMRLNVLQLKQDHPRFEVILFDDNDCLHFIRKYFDTDVVNAFLYLKPGAYKADLFRLCVLYIHGGIYIDIKYRCIHDFRLDYFLDKEYLVLDLPCVFWKEYTHGIYNGLMVSKPMNYFLFECIQNIVKNTNEKYYGINHLFPTGPGLLGNIYFKDCNTEEEFMKKITEFECGFHWNIVNIIMENTAILEIYPEYRKDQKESCPNNYYCDLWKNNDIYNNEIEMITFNKDLQVSSSIPLNLFQTWSSKENIPMEIQKYINVLKEQNPEFNYQLYDDTDCEEFIEKNFESSVLNTFRKLIPGAYKADLFRYCILFKLGGIYLDIKYYGIDNFKMLYLTDKEYFVRDLECSGYGIYNAFMVCYPGNDILKSAIYQIVENTKNEYYGINYFYPTGPLLLKPFFDQLELELVHREVIDENQNKKYYIAYNNGSNILYYNIKEYRSIQRLESKKHYSMLWEEKNIYDTTIIIV